jgi:LPXTG-site transpeptidase (sortase) family protein
MAAIATSPVRTAAHAVGNVLIGVALGLGVYYFATDALQYLRQSELAEDLSTLGAVGAPAPDSLIAEGDQFDWEGYETDDRTYWETLEDGGVFARLIIEDVELDSVVVKGHSRANLKRGPAWIDYTDLPGPTGNCGISGHRTTYGGPFRRLDELQAGDTLDLYSPYRRYRYSVTEVFRVRPWETEVVDSTADPQLTLTACDPPYSAAYRLIVTGELVEVARLEEQ